MNHNQMISFAKIIEMEDLPKGKKALKDAVIKQLEKSGPWANIAEGVQRTANAVLEEKLPVA